MNQKQIDSLATEVSKVIVEVVKPLKLELEAAKQRIAALEAKPNMKFCGTWKPGTYSPGDAVVRDGGLWVCKVETPGEPSKDFVGWQNAHRKGSL